ncbi:response regulator [Streptomyces sp. NPDC091376]|uniref:response regulator n=1 Tax=Streptomyces sp. NPDC091376 TaxID=3365994 RepID=UPI00382A0DD0
MTPDPPDLASILLVDDMDDNLNALEAVLDPLNQRLVRASSGPEAMKALLRHDFAVILLDVLMPGMDGFETATHIKRLDQTKDVPIIFLTGVNIDSSYAFRGYASGAVDYLTKPFDPWILRAKVTVFLELHQQRKQLHALLRDDLHQLDDLSERLSQVENQLASAGGDRETLCNHISHLEEAVREIRQHVTARYSPALGEEPSSMQALPSMDPLGISP